MNYMKQVAQMFGVELGEEFNIIGMGDTIYKLNKDGIYKIYDDKERKIYSDLLENILIGEFEIIKLPKPILDSEEKKYLSNVIKPFRDDVKCIIKYSVDYVEWITICMKICHDMDFPIFDVGTMYKGMQLDKEYTLEELGL